MDEQALQHSTEYIAVDVSGMEQFMCCISSRFKATFEALIKDFPEVHTDHERSNLPFTQRY